MAARTPQVPQLPPILDPLLSVVIVNYKTWADVERLVVALAAAPEVRDGRCEVVVVDNASDVPVPPSLADPPTGSRVVLRPDNGGFAAGVNAGARAARGRWLLLVNPDVEAGADLPGRVLERVAHLEARADGAPGVVGFALRNPDGTRQPSVGVEPGLVRSLRGLFIPRPRRKYQPSWRVRTGPVPWVTGACALVEARLLRALGGMDEDFFLYYEEVALCRAVRALGRRVEYDPSVEVVHLRPLQNRRVAPQMRVITRHSLLLYFRKHLPRWQFAAMVGLVAAEAAVKGGWARWCRAHEAARAWDAVGRVARALGRGRLIRGPEVRDLAAAVAVGAEASTAGRKRPSLGIPGPAFARRRRTAPEDRRIGA